MTILTGEDLSRQLRTICDAVKERLWIAVPFIGDAKAVRQLLGKRWIEDENLGVRLLIDKENAAYLNSDSIERFRMKGDIKHLLGLHAKLYIADNKAILTSANLTRTAFARRFEAGIFIGEDSISDIVSLYAKWWKKAEPIAPAWFRRHHLRPSKTFDGEIDKGSGLPTQYKLPDDPGDVGFKNDRDLRVRRRAYGKRSRKTVLGSRTITLSETNIRYQSIKVSDALDLFLPKTIGGGSEAEAGRTFSVYWGGPEPVVTDIAGDKKIFRRRSWKQFFDLYQLTAGDRVVIKRLGHYRYRIAPLR